MDETKKVDSLAVYEISFLIVPRIPEEKIPEEADKIEKIALDAGAEMITKEAPHRERLAYTMRKKTVSGSYEKCDSAYFGWIKFKLPGSKIEVVKKAIETLPSVLRMLVINTVEENTYLGKRASQIAASLSEKTEPVEDKAGAEKEKKEVVLPAASQEEMDRSIDEMVKEAV